MKQLLDFITEHKGTISVIGMWIVREIPAVWSWCKETVSAVYPFLKANGGLKGIKNNILNGEKQNEKTTNAVNASTGATTGVSGSNQ